jgi:diguanylate cyclase (GGDEF)-like protein/PAS domain S-box-containing protein
VIEESVIAIDKEGRVTYLNPSAERITELRNETARGRLISEVFTPMLDGPDGTRPRIGENLLALGFDEYYFNSAVFRAPSGKYHYVTGNTISIREANGIDRVLVLFRDSSELKFDQSGLIFQSTHDFLTGLLNRREFAACLGKLFDLENVSQSHILLHLDLDEFKIINATCGHVAGDELLCQVSSILKNQVRGSDLLARLGGDEFGVLLDGCDVGEGRRIADQIRWAIQDYRFIWEGKSFVISASIGMVMVEPHHGDWISWLRDADAACYVAKDEGRNQVHLFGRDEVNLLHHTGQMRALGMLHDAIAHDRLLLYAQPIIPLLESAQDLPHMEILLRMLDERGNIILPGEFLPTAERYHQMPLVDRWVVTGTFSTLNRLCISNSYIFAINLSGQSIGRPDFLHFVIESLDEFDINPQNLCFEITEGAAIHNVENAMEFMSILKARGCRFALDDFGVGMSSLAYLRRLPIDYLKIDGSFMSNLTGDPINTAIVRAIQTVARVTGVKTVAESVETVGDLRLLKEIGIDLAQGYLIARPMRMEELCQLDFTDMDMAANDSIS